MVKQTISILGCGWLGLPLAKSLLEKGYIIKGSTTFLEKKKELATSGIDAYIIKVEDKQVTIDRDDFFMCETLIINFPPERRADIVEFHLQQFNSLTPYILGIPKIILISSTSVYPFLSENWITEECEQLPVKLSGKALRTVEEHLIRQPLHRLFIIRAGGLYGPYRKIGRFLSNKEITIHPNERVNLVHQFDCIQFITLLLTTDIYGGIFNLVADKHPLKEELYTIRAKEEGFSPPRFNHKLDKPYKLIDNQKLHDIFDFTFTYPNPAINKY